MFESPESQRQVGRFAWVMAWVGLVVGQLHALSRFATADGREDLEYPLTAAWAVPAADVLGPLLGWAHPNLVYVHYGKIWLPVCVAFTLAALVRLPASRPSGSSAGLAAPCSDTAVGGVGVFLDTGRSGRPTWTTCSSRSAGSSRCRACC